MTSDHWITLATKALNINLRKHGTRRADGPCPFCAAATGVGGVDRFVVFEEGNYWCQQCGTKGWWIEKPLSADDVARQLEQKQEQTRAAYENMHQKDQDWIGYNKAVKLDLWAERGITPETVNRWGLGYCDLAPYTDPPKPSLTIPIHYGGKLYDIRHRILGGVDGQKYRSHLAGIQPLYFNLDNLGSAPTVYLVEGELKAIYLMQEGFTPVIAYPGVKFLQFLPGLIKRQGAKGQEFAILPDPGTENAALKVLKLVVEAGYRASIVDLIEKPDDFLAHYGEICMRQAIGFRSYVK